MNDFWLNVLISVLSNIISDLLLWVILILISLGLIKQIIRYNNLQKFFGLNRNSNQLLIYVSSLPVPLDLVFDRYGKQHPFNLLVLPAVEVEVISWISVLFASTPLQRLPQKF
ncbi:MAG: hypothetical protein Kow00121_66700 [Elainellaceae cyanobacterium]